MGRLGTVGLLANVLGERRAASRVLLANVLWYLRGRTGTRKDWRT